MSETDSYAADILGLHSYFNTDVRNVGVDVTTVGQAISPKSHASSMSIPPKTLPNLPELQGFIREYNEAWSTIYWQLATTARNMDDVLEAGLAMAEYYAATESDHSRALDRIWR